MAPRATFWCNTRSNLGIEEVNIGRQELESFSALLGDYHSISLTDDNVEFITWYVHFSPHKHQKILRVKTPEMII